MSSKELLSPKEMTSAELRVLVDEYVANGGKITQCAPGVALNFRSGIVDQVFETPKVKVIKKRKNKGKK